MTHASPDGPTKRTRGDRLAAASLSGLPAMFEPSDASANANARYEKVLEYYLSHQTSLQRDPVEADAAKLSDLLVDAMNAGNVTRPFLDDFVPLKPGEPPSFDDALESIPAAALHHAQKLHEQGRKDAALSAAQAVWAFGQRLFENSVLLINRRNGLMMMVAAGDALYPMADALPAGAAGLEAWSTKLSNISSQWQEKVEVVSVVRPHIGDLLNLAQNDQDLTFRVEATRQMAVAKFNPGHRGNEKAIAAYLAEAKNSPDPLVAEAAKAADAFTVEELRRLK